MSRIGSLLAKMALAEPTPDVELERLRRDAWRYQGVAVLRPEEVQDEWTRQALVNEAERRYGRRVAR